MTPAFGSLGIEGWHIGPSGAAVLYAERSHPRVEVTPGIGRADRETDVPDEQVRVIDRQTAAGYRGSL
jgi:hypothetical protein